MRALVALLLFGCGGGGLSTPPDMAIPYDFSIPANADLSFQTCTPSAAFAQKFVVDTVTVPMSSNDFAYDLNGDGHADNRMGNILGAFSMNGIDVQTPVTQAITSGMDVMLLTERSGDPLFQTDACAGTVEQQGLAHAPGSALAPDPAYAPGSFTGTLQAGRFTSAGAGDVQMTLFLAPGTSSLIPMPLHGAQLRYTLTAGKLQTGQINGAILKTDLQGTIVPALADTLTQRLMSGGSGGQNATISSIYDTGGTDDGSGCVTATPCAGNTPPTGAAACKNPASYPATVPAGVAARAGKCADQCDNIVDVCEVSTNQLVKNLLAPDVQLFQNGVYAPSKNNTMKDSLSVGVGFTATSATF